MMDEFASTTGGLAMFVTTRNLKRDVLPSRDALRSLLSYYALIIDRDKTDKPIGWKLSVSIEGKQLKSSQVHTSPKIPPCRLQ